MARILKEEEYATKRNEILDAAQRLIYSRGYNQMAIQEIIDQLQISKGAFYHYFGSKQALLEAIISRSVDQAMQLLLPLVEDPGLPALEKMNLFFSSSGQWKIQQKELMLALLRIWYADENALLRQKVQAESIRRMSPLLTQIIQQGIREGCFSTPFPGQSGEVVFTLLLGFGELNAGLLLELGLGQLPPESRPRQAELLQQILDNTAAFTSAFERILGAPPGSLEIMPPDLLAQWLE
jgi:AcrR family transcriptional regulator